jgi:hypothetical protein
MVHDRDPHSSSTIKGSLVVELIVPLSEEFVSRGEVVCGGFLRNAIAMGATMRGMEHAIMR